MQIQNEHQPINAKFDSLIQTSIQKFKKFYKLDLNKPFTKNYFSWEASNKTLIISCNDKEEALNLFTYLEHYHWLPRARKAHLIGIGNEKNLVIKGKIILYLDYGKIWDQIIEKNVSSKNWSEIFSWVNNDEIIMSLSQATKNSFLIKINQRAQFFINTIVEKELRAQAGHNLQEAFQGFTSKNKIIKHRIFLKSDKKRKTSENEEVDETFPHPNDVSKINLLNISEKMISDLRKDDNVLDLEEGDIHLVDDDMDNVITTKPSENNNNNSIQDNVISKKLPEVVNQEEFAQYDLAHLELLEKEISVQTDATLKAIEETKKRVFEITSSILQNRYKELSRLYGKLTGFNGLNSQEKTALGEVEKIVSEFRSDELGFINKILSRISTNLEVELEKVDSQILSLEKQIESALSKRSKISSIIEKIGVYKQWQTSLDEVKSIEMKLKEKYNVETPANSK